MHQVSKLQITKLNPHLTCLLCRGYFIEATTIIECLHSFCKTCIVRYLETNKFCPVCEVQVHKTKPLLNIRSDQTLQDIVYKLVPGLFQHEMRLRRDFYSKHPDQLPPALEDRGEVSDYFIYSSDETICLSLEYADDLSGRQEDTEDESGSQLNGKRFLRCPAAVTVGLLKRLIRGKYGLDSNHALDILYGDSFLCDEYSLVDLAYIYNWRRKGPMRLKYRIYQRQELANTLTNGTNGNVEATEEIKEEKRIENKEMTTEVQLEISESGVMSASNVDTNCITEQTDQLVSTSVNEKLEESVEVKKVHSPQTESSPGASTTTAIVSNNDTSVKTNGETPMDVEDSVETKTEASVSVNTSIPAVDATKESVSNSTAPQLAVSVHNKTIASTSHKSLKPPPTWNQSVNRVGIKRTSSTMDNDSGSPERTLPTSAKRATPSSPSKTPRFFKIRNSPQPSPTDNNVVACKPPAASIASVTESPVQEVAVNLTKVPTPTSPKKPADKERSSREGKVPSPRLDSSTNNSIRPYATPAPSQSKRQPSPNLAAEEAAARLRQILNPISSSATVTSSSSGESSIQQLGFPTAAWLNLARGPNRPAAPRLGIGPPFNNRPPLSPAHFISSLMASHPNYNPYLPMSLLPPPEGKKSLPASTSSSSSSSSLSQSTHKPISPRTSSSFPTPTFNLNALQQCIYRPNLSPLLPNLPSELVGSFYHSSYVQRPFMSGRSGPTSVSPKSVSSSSTVSSSGSGGFHPSLPPTVTSASSNSSVGKKSSPGLRPLVPRRTVAPPPPLVPIGTTPCTVRSPPTLLPIKDVVEKEPSVQSKVTPSSTASNCVKVVESSIARTVEDAKNGSVPESSNDQPTDSNVESKDPPPKENGQEGTGKSDSGKPDASTTPPLECSNSKLAAEKTELDKSESKLEVATAPS